jgi:hypothetical protein
LEKIEKTMQVLEQKVVERIPIEGASLEQLEEIPKE